MAIKIWVGKRESDILTYQYFDVSITFWGSNTNNNHSFCSSNRVKANYNKKFTEFVKDLLIKYISLDKNTEIHFYNNEFAYKLMNLERKRLNFRHGYKNPRPHFCNRSTLIIHI